jgi:hypothetical protein
MTGNLATSLVANHQMNTRTRFGDMSAKGSGVLAGCHIPRAPLPGRRSRCQHLIPRRVSRPNRAGACAGACAEQAQAQVRQPPRAGSAKASSPANRAGSAPRTRPTSPDSGRTEPTPPTGPGAGLNQGEGADHHALAASPPQAVRPASAQAQDPAREQIRETSMTAGQDWSLSELPTSSRFRSSDIAARHAEDAGRAITYLGSQVDDLSQVTAAQALAAVIRLPPRRLRPNSPPSWHSIAFTSGTARTIAMGPSARTISTSASAAADMHPQRRPRSEPSAPGSPAAPLGGHRFRPVSQGIATASGGCSLQRGTATSSSPGTAHPGAPAGIDPGLRRATDPSLLPGDGQMLRGGSVSSAGSG